MGLPLPRCGDASARHSPGEKPSRAAGGALTATLTIAAGVLFGLVSLGAIQGVRSDRPMFGMAMPFSETWWSGQPAAYGRWTWVPRWMALIAYPPFANLTDAEVSQKKPGWNKKNDDLDSVIGAQLPRANLQYASASDAFFAGADLSWADLKGADLKRSDLRGADLGVANLEGADMRDANLRGATLTIANLRGAYLDEADLSDAILNSADLTGAS